VHLGVVNTSGGLLRTAAMIVEASSGMSEAVVVCARAVGSSCCLRSCCWELLLDVFVLLEVVAICASDAGSCFQID
jgi:hypothetical protein